MAKTTSMVGRQFGRLYVIKKSTDSGKSDMWICNCECGREKVAYGVDLRRGHTQSCGCLKRQATSEANTKHGHTQNRKIERLYRIWTNMKTRCYNPKCIAYERYGGRGITVCDEWLHDYSAFRTWALENGYNEDLSIDRVDNNDGYHPNNCRWATVKEQNSNRRTRRWQKRPSGKESGL